MSRLLQTSLIAGGKPAPRVTGGEGARIHLEDGRWMLDGSNTGGPLGHRHPKMIEALRHAAELPVINEGWPWIEREQAGDELFETCFQGEDWAGAVRFCLSASEANDMALSFAQAFTGRQAIGTRERAYHGFAGLSRSVTVQPQWHGGLAVLDQPSKPAPEPFPVRQLPAPLGAKFGDPGTNQTAAERLAGAADLLSDVAATVIDYTQGGYYHDPEYQDIAARAIRQAGSLWIADETVTGAGRFGQMFTFQAGSERPDIVVMGKGLAGGGSPVGAVIFSQKLVDGLKGMSWRNYSTFRGHPVTMACVRAYLKALKEEDLLAHVRAMEKVVKARMADIFARHPSVLRIDGNGLHWTVELHGPDWRTFYANTSDVPLATKVVARAAEQGVMLATSGEETQIFMAPPLIVTEAEIHQILDALEAGLEVADALYEAA
ncbi:aminotransferase class III-fold pyridoxal phosphate-dependent enzyme [Chachezhania sediminis]|uniref:aminotransferase class III-fold pyridoxal phosphate-dependent enzyme n=1 Tax=Chachezhania sediminis TaxID=2599291 RepID=UPI00131B97DF|nr:aminotransferase class III-fold pyridoxal phosphate-dependent enzyme [Chachezhania sediminis]